MTEKGKGPRRIYLIHPVRKETEESKRFCDGYVGLLEEAGHTVFYPARDNPYEKIDETGSQIWTHNMAGMEPCDEVHVYWDPESTGSKSDIGMALALKKPLVVVYMDSNKKGPCYETLILDWPWGVRDKR